MRTTGKLLLTASLAVAAASVTGPTKASLINDDVTFTCSGGPTCGSKETGKPNATVGANVEFTAGVHDIPLFEFDLDGSSITMTNITDSNFMAGGDSAAFFEFTDLNGVGQTGQITSATITTSGVQLTKAFDFSFTGDSFTFNFAGEPRMDFGPGGSITANLSGSAPATDVPTPATLGLLVTGLVGMGFHARRRRDI